MLVTVLSSSCYVDLIQMTKKDIQLLRIVYILCFFSLTPNNALDEADDYNCLIHPVVSKKKKTRIEK